MGRTKKNSRKLTSSQANRCKKYYKKHQHFVLAIKSKGKRRSKVYVCSSSEKLIEVLQGDQSYETLAGDGERTDIIRQLNDLAQNWVKDVAEIRGMCEFKAQELSGKLYTYGSYRLGVHNQTTEMDTIIFVPKIIQSNDFYDLFYRLLRIQPEITKCRLFNKGKFYSLRMEYNGFGVNMTMARLPYEKIPEDFDPNNIELHLLDEFSLFSIHGLKMTNAIIDLVPNFQTFSVSLHAIRLWATCCGMYSEFHGFLRGGALTILVAYVCRMYPKAAPSKIVRNFFHFYAHWDWCNPIQLIEVNDLGLGVPMWDPIRNGQERPSLISVITPVYPQQNLTKNVFVHIQYMFVQELIRAYNTCKLIHKDQLSWKYLFKTNALHSQWTHFLTLKTFAPTWETHKVWSELVKSNLNFFYKAWVTCDTSTISQLNISTQSDDDVNYSSAWLILIRVVTENVTNVGHLPSVLVYFRRHLKKLSLRKRIYDRRLKILAFFEPRCLICEPFNYQGNLIFNCDCNIRFIFGSRTPEQLLADEIYTKKILYLEGRNSNSHEIVDDIII